MRVHGNQLDPNLLQVYAPQAAAKTKAKKEAERTRRKLLNAASALGGEYEDGADCVVRLSGDGEGAEHAGGQDREGQNRQVEGERAGAGSGEDVIKPHGWGTRTRMRRE